MKTETDVQFEAAIFGNAAHRTLEQYASKKGEPTPKMTKTQQFKINGKVEHSPAKTKRRAKARVASRSRRINRHKR
jgi:hypothetical protein